MASQFNQFASEKTKLVYFCRLAQQIIACFDFYYFVKNGVTVSENRKKTAPSARKRRFTAPGMLPQSMPGELRVTTMANPQTPYSKNY